MRMRQRGIAATEVTVVGALMAFLMTIIVPTMDALRTESADIPRASENDRRSGLVKEEPEPTRHHYKQIGLAVLNYQNSIGPVFEEVFTTVGDDQEYEPGQLVELILELDDNAELYRQFLVTVRYHLERAESKADVEYLLEVEFQAQEMLDSISTLQEFLDVLVLPPEVMLEFESEESIVEMILNER